MHVALIILTGVTLGAVFGAVAYISWIVVTNVIRQRDILQGWRNESLLRCIIVAGAAAAYGAARSGF